MKGNPVSDDHLMDRATIEGRLLKVYSIRYTLYSPVVDVYFCSSTIFSFVYP